MSPSPRNARLRDGEGEPYPLVTFHLDREDAQRFGDLDGEMFGGDEAMLVAAVAAGAAG